MISAIQTALNTPEARARNWRMSLQSWLSDQEKRAERVAHLRKYADGEHDADLTPEMQDMLRISTAGGMDRFNDNYMDLIIQTPADRMTVDRFETDNDAANEWIRDLLAQNRFDALQGDVHEATLRDADTMLLTYWDTTERRVRWSHEPAYDGIKGMLVVLAPDNSVQIAIKVWHESRESLGDTVMVAVYYDNRIETFSSVRGSALTRVNEPQVYQPLQGKAVGQPVTHFANRVTAASGYGKSEIEDAIPLQNALNRTLHSMVATAELTGFPIRYFIGFDPGSGALTPGMMIKLKDNIPADAKIMLGTLEQGEIIPYIQQAEWLTTEMGRITRTPSPEFMGSSASSGEALKQREMGLLGKVRRFQVKAGNRWEDAIRLAWRVEAANGSTPPDFTTIKTIWKPAELRNETEIINNAKTLHDMGYEEEALRQMAAVFEWDERKIIEIMDERRAQQARNFADMAGDLNLPTFQNAFTQLQSANGGST